MEVQRTPVDNTPLLVNLLRLIRDARSPNYKDHEKGPVTFHFGGLCMRDTGGYDEAEELWRWASADHRHNHSTNSSDSDGDASFRGPLHLAVYLNHSPVEVWTLKDFRDPTTEHSVPRDFEQLEQLNTLVRVLFAHLRSQEIYGVVLQSCVTSADDASVTQTDVFDGRTSAHTTAAAAAAAASSPLSPLPRETTSSSIRGPHSPLNHVSLRLFSNHEECPRIPINAQKQFLWSSEDFVRVDVVVNKAWRYQTAPPSSAFPLTTAATTAVGGQERSSPIQTSRPTSRAQTGDIDTASHSTSPEVTGSLAKSSLPTPHLAPAVPSPSSVNRTTGVSPTSRISPLFTNQRQSPVPALSDFVLPPPELSELYDNDATRQSRSSPLGPHNPYIFSSVPGIAAGKSNVLASPIPGTAASQSVTVAAMTAAVGHLEDAMWLSDAMHVRRMGTLVSAGKDGGSPTAAGSSSSSSSSPLGAKRNSSVGYGGGGGAVSSFAPARPQVGSLLAAASVGALSGLDLDSPLGWSGTELEDFADEDAGFGVGSGERKHRDTALGSHTTADDTTGQLMALLGLCSSVKLHHVTPAPFGDLVIALNLKDASA